MLLTCLPPEHGFNRGALAARLRSLANDGVWIRDQFLEIRRLARSDLYARTLRPLAAAFSQKKFEGRVPGRIRRHLSRGLRRLLLLSISIAAILAAPVHIRSHPLAVCIESSRRGDAEVFPKHARYGARAGTRVNPLPPELGRSRRSIPRSFKSARLPRSRADVRVRRARSNPA